MSRYETWGNIRLNVITVIIAVNAQNIAKHRHFSMEFYGNIRLNVLSVIRREQVNVCE